jgi:undecaprenyl diphosphate synthase
MATTLKQSLFTEEQLATLDSTSIPCHIAIVMDGNRRWAREKGLPIAFGHAQGAETLDLIVRAAASLGVKRLTVYAFSTENRNRTKEEINLLMELLETYLIKKKKSMIEEGVHLETIGDLSKLSLSVQRVFEETKRATSHLERIHLVMAVNYGSRDEICRAFLKMARDMKRGALSEEEINEKTLGSYLDSAAWEDPELYIRAGGEARLSNFLLWQSIYSEIIFSKVLWPDFSPENLLFAIKEYQTRKRRFGE